MPSSKELVELARAGEKSAFGQLVGLYERAAIITAFAILRDYHAAQDVAQDAFLNAYASLHQLRDSSTFGPWVLQIVRRKALLVNKSVRLEPIATEVESPLVSESIAWIDQYEHVIEQLARLPDHERIVMVQKYIDGHSVQEIANTTGKPTETIRKQIFRALQRLRILLKEVLS